MTEQVEPLNGRVPIEMDDIQAMFAINPLAHEQVKSIALQREVRTRDAEIKKLTEQLADKEK
jgi:hypothetical protein|tara:strand:- start:136 stop:321 length:186 start_codon:yes stop_codon:yes gene_type:complete